MPITIKVRAQNPYEAYATLWNVLTKMPFYKQHGYKVALPEDEEILDLANNPTKLETINREELGKRYVENIYRPSDFDVSLSAVKAEINKVEKAAEIFEKLQEYWNFKILPEYLVLLTLYGPGGNYNAETGTILVRTSAEGTFSFPILQNIIHEMTHIGIEDNLVKKFQLSHQEKEALVDRMCLINFGDLFSPNANNTKNNPFTSTLTSETMKNLPGVIEDYVLKYPRK